MATRAITDVPLSIGYWVCASGGKQFTDIAVVVTPPVVYFRMRGIDTTCAAPLQPAYVSWTVQDAPDFTASQLSAGDLPCGSDPLTDVSNIAIAGRWTV